MVVWGLLWTYSAFHPAAAELSVWSEIDSIILSYSCWFFTSAASHYSTDGKHMFIATQEKEEVLLESPILNSYFMQAVRASELWDIICL